MNEKLRRGSKFGKLTLSQAAPSARGSKATWTCDCGKTTEKDVGNVLRGVTKSCGRCLEVTAEEMASRKFGNLRMRDPAIISAGSGKRVIWICDCGREVNIIIHSVLQDGTSSCGRCDEISETELRGKKFGSLFLRHPEPLSPHSHRKVEWVCDCGRETASQVRYVLNGTVKSCGRCSEISTDEMASRKFGRLRMKNPSCVLAGSNKKVWWICDCGRENPAQVVAVVSGRTRSCGRCYLSFRQRYEAERDIIRLLRTPISPDQLPDWCPQALEVITAVKRPFHARCRLCDGEYHPRWSGIRVGKSLTCGCSVSQVSSGQGELFSFITGLGVDAILEHSAGGLTYDMYVPSVNLLIEFNGIRWHSKPGSKARDIAKYRNAIGLGFCYLMVFEDEWRCGKQKIQDIVRQKLRLNSATRVRAGKCEIKLVDRAQADTFYELHHYIGKSGSPVNYGAFNGGCLIACCSFRRPTRKSSHDWELSRMCMLPDFRAQGLWSRIFKRFLAENGACSVVSFSDNRLFDGGVYGKLGFRLDGEVRPDYYWVKSDRRHHKSTLRKSSDEILTGRTEVELRTAQGYRQIWDLGKKRWVHDCISPLNIGSDDGR